MKRDVGVILLWGIVIWTAVCLLEFHTGNLGILVLLSAIIALLINIVVILETK